LLVFLGFIGLQVVLAQTRQISGVVTSGDDGTSIPGVSIVVKGSTLGTITDMDGKFTLKAPNTAKALVVSFVGMTSVEVPITSSSKYSVTLKAESISVDEVVVTAMGIKRSEKTLGYAATTVAGDELLKSRNSNVANSLSGKVAGLQIQATSSDPGAVSSVIIRGFGSINGSNQPLYVVDGVPLQNSTINTSGHSISTGGIANVAPDDVESMTVLKGAAATALYGSRAANGVILITTKEGKKGNGRNFTLSYNGGLQAREVSIFPTLQNEFGQGWNGNQTYIENGSWGPRLDGSTQVYGPIWNNQQLMHKYSALKNNVKDFFDIGLTKNHNFSLSGVSTDGKLNYFLSYSNSMMMVLCRQVLIPIKEIPLPIVHLTKALTGLRFHLL